MTKIRKLPDSQLKDIQEDSFIKVLKDYYQYSDEKATKETY